MVARPGLCSDVACYNVGCFFHLGAVLLRYGNNPLVVQAEVDRLEHLIDAYANRADYILEAVEQTNTPVKLL